MTPLKEFQARFGSEYNGIVTSECFAQALSISNAEKIQAIAALTDEEIDSKGKIILADLRGHLQYEAALLGLHERKEFVFGQLPPEEYPDPEKEAHEEMMSGSATIDDDEEAAAIEDMSTPAPPPAKTLRKTSTRRKKKKKR